MDSKSSHVHFFTSLPIQSVYGSNIQDLFQKFELDNTTNYQFNFQIGEALSVSASLPFWSRSISKS